MNEQNLDYFRTNGTEADLAKVLANTAAAYSNAGRYAESIRLNSEALEYVTRSGNLWEIANIQSNLGIIFSSQEALDEAEAAYKAAVAGFQQCGDQIRIAATLNNYGWSLHRRNLTQARAMLQQALALSRTLGDPFNEALASSNLATVALAEGEVGEAGQHIVESLRVYASVNVPIPLSFALERAAEVMMLQGDAAFATQLLSLVRTLRYNQCVLPPADQAHHDSLLAMLRSQTDAATWAVWWDAGRIAPPQTLVEAVIERLAAST